MEQEDFISISLDLEEAGLLWRPEIGDEVVDRSDKQSVSILVSPQGLTPDQLRQSFVWLPTIEQLVLQIEARQAMLFHAGISKSFDYETVIKATAGLFEARAVNFRSSIAKAFSSFLTSRQVKPLH